jgi:hypothetical protein
MLLTLSKREKALWLATLIDCEGCLGAYFQGEGYLSRRIEIANSDLFLLEEVKEQLGYGAITKLQGKNKPCYHWMVSSTDDILEVLNIVDPFLIVKKRQSPILRELCNLRLDRNSSIETKVYCAKLVQALSDLKERNSVQNSVGTASTV